jgi:hypothetical protein
VTEAANRLELDWQFHQTVVEAMRLHLAGLSNRVHRDVVKSQLAKQQPDGR